MTDTNTSPRRRNPKVLLLGIPLVLGIMVFVFFLGGSFDGIFSFLPHAYAPVLKKVLVIALGFCALVFLIFFIRKDKDIRQSMGAILTTVISLVGGGVAGYYLYSLFESTVGIQQGIELKIFFTALTAFPITVLLTRIIGGISREQQGGVTQFLILCVILIAIFAMSSCVKKWSHEEETAEKESLYLTIVAPTEGSSFPVGTPIRIVWESNVPKQKIEIQWCGKSIGCRKEDWHYVLMLRNGDNGGEFVWSPPQSLRGDVSIFVGMLVPQRFQEEFGSVWVLEARTKIQIQ